MRLVRSWWPWKRKLEKGWLVHEEIGIVVINDYIISKIEMPPIPPEDYINKLSESELKVRTLLYEQNKKDDKKHIYLDCRGCDDFLYCDDYFKVIEDLIYTKDCGWCSMMMGAAATINYGTINDTA